MCTYTYIETEKNNEFGQTFQYFMQFHMDVYVCVCICLPTSEQRRN